MLLRVRILVKDCCKKGGDHMNRRKTALTVCAAILASLSFVTSPFAGSATIDGPPGSTKVINGIVQEIRSDERAFIISDDENKRYTVYYTQSTVVFCDKSTSDPKVTVGAHVKVECIRKTVNKSGFKGGSCPIQLVANRVHLSGAVAMSESLRK
jgi:hypothetical protein